MITAVKQTNNAPIDENVQHELSRLTATLANLAGPPAVAGKPEPSSTPANGPLLKAIEHAPPFEQTGWNTFAASQLNAMAALILNYVKSHAAAKQGPLLPVAGAALDLSKVILRGGADQRINAEKLASQPKT